MFLDPQVNLGKASKKDVVDIFVNELGVSKTMAGMEYERYAFNNRGQATSYYYGFKEITKVLEMAKKKNGKDFNLMCFNNALLSIGLVPVRMQVENLVTASRCSK